MIKRHKWGWTAIGLAVAAGAGAAWADDLVKTSNIPLPAMTQPATDMTNPDPSRYLFEDQIKPGMKGYGLTVMHGGKIEKFDIEVIDVLKNFSAGQNGILVKCSGLGLEHSGIIAGMSGSPVYIDGKMIGAVAFGWGTSKDPIGGVQPIRQMLSIPVAQKTQVQQASGGARWGQGATLLSTQARKLSGWSKLVDNLGGPKGVPWNAARTPREMSLRPLASPLMVGGTSNQSLAYLQAAMEGTGLVPVASGSGSGGEGSGKEIGGMADLKPGEIKLEPGSAIAIPLLTGDMDMSAIGTVTEVRGDRVWAFGHAMLADGPTQLPISTGYIYTVMPSLVQSFKVGTSYQAQGSLTTDEQTGIVGTIGAKVDTVPIVIRVKNSDGLVNKEYHYQMAQNRRLTPEILGAALTESLTAQRALPKEFTAKLTGLVKFAPPASGADPELKLENLGTSASFNLAETLLPVALLADNPFENLKLTSVQLEAVIEGVDRSAEIKSAAINKQVVAPGETVIVTVELARYQKTTRTMELNVKVPADAAEGDYQLAVGSADMLLSQEAEVFPQRFMPVNIKTLVDDVQHIMSYRHDKVYARLVMDIQGAAMGGREMKNLPASRVAMYASEKRTDATPLFEAITESADADAVVDGGGQTFVITVDKQAGKRFHKAVHRGMLGIGEPLNGNPASGAADKVTPPPAGGDGGNNDPFK